MREIEVEHRGRDQQDDKGPSKAIGDREQADPHQMRDPAHRSHEGVLDGPFPALPGDRKSRLHEDKRQIAPEQRPDEEIELSTAQVERAGVRAERAEPRCEIPDRKHADQAVEEPHDLPHPVALDDVELPLGEPEQRVQLRMPYSGAHQAGTSSSASASSFLPVRRMNTSSRVAASPSPYVRISSAGLPSASTRPPSIIRTRSHSAAASSMSCVQRSTVTSRSARSI